MGINTAVYNIEYEVRLHTRRNGLTTVYTSDVLRIDVQTTKRSFGSSWRVIFVPREYDTDGSTVYDLVEAMDYCEIAVKRENAENANRTIIRGFVSKVFKTNSIKDGKPERYIAVSGEDYGKIIRMAYIHYAVGLDPYQVILASGSVAPLAVGYGIDAATKPCPPSKFIQALFDTFVTPNFENVKSFIDPRSATDANSANNVNTALASNTTTPHQDKFGDFLTDIDADGVDGIRALNCNLQIVDRLAGAKETPVEAFLLEMAGLPWNEIFIDNAPNASFLVFRSVPYRDRTGNYVGSTYFAGADGGVVNSGRADTNTPVDISQADIVGYQVQRSDEEVVNYYFVDSLYSPIGERFEDVIRSRAIQDQKIKNPHYVVGETQLGGNTVPASDKLEFSRIELFGFRKAAYTTRFLSTAPGVEDISKIYADNQDQLSMIFTGDVLNRVLFDSFEHNSVLETAIYEIKGNENIRPGMFVRLTDARNNASPSVYYVNDVNHTIIPFETFTTQLVLVRGEGHLDYINNKKNP